MLPDASRCFQMLPDACSEDEIERVIGEIDIEKEIDLMIKKATKLARTGSPEEISRNMNRIAALSIRFREGAKY
jgi:hypothetical protein